MVVILDISAKSDVIIISPSSKSLILFYISSIIDMISPPLSRLLYTFRDKKSIS